MASDSSLLKENDGVLELHYTWYQSIFKRIVFLRVCQSCRLRSTVFELTGVHFRSKLQDVGHVSWQKTGLDQTELGNTWCQSAALTVCKQWAITAKQPVFFGFLKEIEFSFN